jgi:hypothetical protein
LLFYISKPKTGAIIQINPQKKVKERKMKNLWINVLVTGMIVAGYALPALAYGGGGPY